ncbi:hypothetical protein BJ741DRAFT_131860 [Chytriomyces cf. hyalinus JEL632]|nr:hypothetical protein BJ741DRAFT_131860 [Chytriomyces cf. hyalinus JEL632]
MQIDGRKLRSSLGDASKRYFQLTCADLAESCLHSLECISELEKQVSAVRNGILDTDTDADVLGVYEEVVLMRRKRDSVTAKLDAHLSLLTSLYALLKTRLESSKRILHRSVCDDSSASSVEQLFKNQSAASSKQQTDASAPKIHTLFAGIDLKDADQIDEPITNHATTATVADGTNAPAADAEDDVSDLDSADDPDNDDVMIVTHTRTPGQTTEIFDVDDEYHFGTQAEGNGGGSLNELDDSQNDGSGAGEGGIGAEFLSSLNSDMMFGANGSGIGGSMFDGMDGLMDLDLSTYGGGFAAFGDANGGTTETELQGFNTQPSQSADANGGGGSNSSSGGLDLDDF